MGMAANLFSWLHRSEFYSAFHKEAAQLLPEGFGKTWVDVGCGPGVLTREANSRGYKATGLDYDKEMIDRARELSTLSERSQIEFRQFNLLADQLQTPASVVSASSLLPVFSDKGLVIERLKKLCCEDGVIMFIETNSFCTPLNMSRLFLRNPKASELGSILLGIVRSGRISAIESILQNFPGRQIQRKTLSNGVVDVIFVRNQND